MKRMYPLLVATLACMLASSTVRADDIFRGVRGSTKGQCDKRIEYAGPRKQTGRTIFKYWDGKERGKWLFINIPYQRLENSDGLGDITVGGGPRGTIGNFHFLPFVAATLPTGGPERGNDRTDYRAGTAMTYLSEGQAVEVDVALERRWTGGRDGVNPPDQSYAGVVAGGRISPRFRLVGGIVTLLQDDDKRRVSAKAMTRYTPSSRRHFQLGGTWDLENDFGKRGYGVEAIARFNLGKIE